MLEIVIRQIIYETFLPGSSEMFSDPFFRMFQIVGYWCNGHDRMLGDQ
jgi:hypothetical protein